MEPFNQWLNNEGTAILFILIGSAVFYYGGGALVSVFTKGFVRRQYHKQPKKDAEKRTKTLTSLATAVWKTIIGIVAVIAVFHVLFPHIDLTPLFTSAGIIGFAVAFGAQTIVKDFLTGLFLVSENQFRIGDVVSIQGTGITDASGKVERVGTRTTIIRDGDGNVHYIPNGSITHVVNQTMGYSRVNFTLSLANDADLDTAIAVINKTGDTLAHDAAWAKKILEAPQFDSVDAFSADTIEITIIGKVQPSDQWSVTAEMRKRLLRDLKKNNIDLAA